jgi:apolipoprotein N-acyltransferase
MVFRHFLLALLISLLAGSLTACAFAPWHQPELALIGILTLVYVWHHANPHQAFWTGFAFGLAEFGTGISWVQISIHNFGGTTIFISVLVTAVFVLYLSLFPALTGYIFRRLHRNSCPTLNYLILLPSLWVLLDWLRGILFSGFPWLFPGYAFLDLPLRGFAPIVGVYGVSWIGICTVCAFFLLINQRKTANAKQIVSYIGIWIVTWIGGFGLNAIHWTKASASPQHAALIQGNIPFEEKWSIDGIDKSLKTYFDLTQTMIHNPIVIWPETAISINQNEAYVFLKNLNTLGVRTQTAIVTGTIWENREHNVFNAITAVGFKSTGVYLKRHLVPFGEYEPLPFIMAPIFKALAIPMSNFSRGEMNQPLLTIAGNSVASFICYEIAYPSLVLQSAKKASWLLTISDDSWFGHSWASAQQLQMAQMRSLETGREMAYATSNGITAFIDEKGYLISRAPMFVQTILHGTIQPRQGLTPISIYGPSFILVLILITLIISLAISKHTNSEKNTNHSHNS